MICFVGTPSLFFPQFSLLSNVFININLYYNKIRTSDSLNEELPIKMTREKFQRKRHFFYEKIVGSTLIHKSHFLIGQVPIEKYWLKTLFLLFNI